MSEMAFTGPRTAIWHGLGQQLDDGADLDTWKTQAGMDWEVLETPANYTVLGDDMTPEQRVIPDRKVLFRSDTKESLALISDSYKVVQPTQVIEFFRDLTEVHGFKMSTAGTLFGGRKFWALAEVGKSDEVIAGDELMGHLLLTTSCDGSSSTQARFVATRVVCNNTLTLAVNERSSRPVVRVTHKSDFDADAVKIDLGVVDAAWSTFMQNMKKLASVKMNAEQTRKFYEKQIFDPAVPVHEQSLTRRRLVDSLIDKAIYGSGSDFSRGTAYGTLCGITEHFTHGSGKRGGDKQFWSGYVDDGARTALYNDLMRAVA